MTIPWVHPGKRRRLILESLVTEIRLSPWASPEDTEEVKLWVKNKNFTCPRQSLQHYEPPYSNARRAPKKRPLKPTDCKTPQ